MSECPRCSIVVDLQAKIDKLKEESLSGLELAKIKMTIDRYKEEIERAEESNNFLRGLNKALEEKNDGLIKQLGSKVIEDYEKGI